MRWHGGSFSSVQHRSQFEKVNTVQFRLSTIPCSCRISNPSGCNSRGRSKCFLFEKLILQLRCSGARISPPGTRALPRRRRRGHGVRAAVPRSWTAVDTSSPPACVRREPVATDQARLRLRRAAASVDGPGELRCYCVTLWPHRRRRSAAASWDPGCLRRSPQR